MLNDPITFFAIISKKKNSCYSLFKMHTYFFLFKQRIHFRFFAFTTIMIFWFLDNYWTSTHRLLFTSHVKNGDDAKSQAYKIGSTIPWHRSCRKKIYCKVRIFCSDTKSLQCTMLNRKVWRLSSKCCYVRLTVRNQLKQLSFPDHRIIYLLLLRPGARGRTHKRSHQTIKQPLKLEGNPSTAKYFMYDCF